MNEFAVDESVPRSFGGCYRTGADDAVGASTGRRRIARVSTKTRPIERYSVSASSPDASSPSFPRIRSVSSESVVGMSERS